MTHGADARGALRAQALGYRVGPRELLCDVSCALAPGRVTALLGPNGAGKSTLLGLLAGQRPPATGQVWLDGRPLRAWRGDALAVVSQEVVHPR